MANNSEEEIDDTSDTSTGEIADHKSVVESVFPDELRKKFEIYSYRNAATLLANGFPGQFENILRALSCFQISQTMIRLPGGNKGPIAKYVDTLFLEEDGWKETRILADLHVKLMHAKQKSKILSEYVRSGFLDGHRIDFLNGKVALDLEWNSKDQTYDRDLYAFSAFYDAGAVDVG
ncbi:MAG: BglII/BstYI family type II restriction endonuclease, partial [Hyphococcus sp.]